MKENNSFSVRFTLLLSGGKLQLVKKQRIAMIPTPDERCIDQTNGSGSWIELRQSDGKTLYRRVINDPLDEHVEVQTGASEAPFTWKKTSEMERTIIILVPELSESDHLVVLSNKSGKKDSWPVEIARFQVKD